MDMAHELSAFDSDSVMGHKSGTYTRPCEITTPQINGHVCSFVGGKCVAYFLSTFSFHKYFSNLIHCELSFARLRSLQECYQSRNFYTTTLSERLTVTSSHPSL